MSSTVETRVIRFYDIEEGQGFTNVKYWKEPNRESERLEVRIDTLNLKMRSTREEDVPLYFNRLFGKKSIMQTYDARTTWTTDETIERVKTWAQRWNSNDPLSGCAIFKKEVDETPSSFVGHVMFGGGSYPGVTEFGGLVSEEYQRRGFGKEAWTAFIHCYSQVAAHLGAKVLESPLEAIAASCFVENIGSKKNLERLMHPVMNLDHPEGRKGVFYLPLEEIKKKIKGEESLV